MAFAGFKTMGPECPCGCDVDYYVLSSNVPTYPLGWRVMNNRGAAYSGNTVTFPDPTVFAKATPAVVDFRNKIVFTIRSVSGVPHLFTYNMELGDEVDVGALPSGASEAGGGPTGTPFLGCDYVSQRLFYVHRSEATGGGASDYTEDIHVMDYDTTNDSILVSESWTGTTSGVQGILYGAWCPLNNRLYFGFGKNVDHGGAVGSNRSAFLKWVSDTGGAATTLKTLEDSTNTDGDYQIHGVTYSVADDQLIWIERYDHGTDVNSIRTGNEDAASESTLKSANVSSENLIGCKVNFKDGKIYYESFYTEGGIPNVHHQKRMNMDGSSDTVLWDAKQGDWATLGFSGASSKQVNFGCAMETTGAGFDGPGNGSGG